MNQNKKHYFIIAMLCLLSISMTSFAQKETKDKSKKSKFTAYEELVNDSTITKKGVFLIHENDEKVYFEIPQNQLGKEFLWITQYAKTQTGFGYGGTEVVRRVVRWEKFKDQVLLRNVEHLLRADEGSSEEIAVKASSVEEIIESIKIVSFGKDSSLIIQVDGLYTGDLSEFSPKRALNAQSIDKSRTFITSAKAFEKNIEMKVLATYKLKPGSSRSNVSSATVELHHSMISLPEEPMQARIFDQRVGFFSGSHQDFSTDKHQVENVKYIRRWRLEKKDKSKAVSEPVKPIVYYVGRGIPKKWQRYIKEGIEMWQPAFEKAGFKNAIIGKIAPSKEEDPDFDAEDVRYSTVRWLPSTVQNAYGPHVQDPRTGEILEADIRVYHNVLSLIRDWYFTQASPSDPRAQSLPLPDEIMGDALRYVVAHEVGHTLGLRHNFKATYYYDVEKYRDPEFTREYGLEASIMDYGRFNYIAQPGDDVAQITGLGPYDYFAIEWGYKEFQGTKRAEEDIPYLNEIAARQLDNPMVRFGGGRENGAKGAADPHARSEDLGNDPVAATRYGLKNIEYITGYLVEACGEKDKDYSLLSNMYNQVLNQMYRELQHVAAMMGGIEVDNYMYGQPADVYKPTPADEQKEALAFILKYGLHTPDYLLKKDIVQRIGMHGIVDNIAGRQSRLMKSILSPSVATRILDLQAIGYETYCLADIMDDMNRGVMEELYVKTKDTDVFRRKLQRSYVQHLLDISYGKSQAKNDLQAVAKSTLDDLAKDLKKNAGKSKSNMDEIHFNDLLQMIQSQTKS